MKKLLPFPLLSTCLLAMWLLLNQTFSVGHILLGGFLALLGGWVMTALQPAIGGVRNPPRDRHPRLSGAGRHPSLEHCRRADRSRAAAP